MVQHIRQDQLYVFCSTSVNEFTKRIHLLNTKLQVALVPKYEKNTLHRELKSARVNEDKKIENNWKLQPEQKATTSALSSWPTNCWKTVIAKMSCSTIPGGNRDLKFLFV